MAAALATIADDQPHRRRLDRNSHDESALTKCWSGKPKPAPVAAPTIPPSIKLEGRVLATFTTYDDFQRAMRLRIDELRLTRLEVDHLSGNQFGYTSKLMCQPPMKIFGRQSLGDTMGAVGVFLALVESPEQIAKLKAVADALSALAALGITREQFAQVAVPKKTNMGSLDGALIAAGAKLALVEDSAATRRVMSRAEQRQRPLRQAQVTDAS